MVAPVRPYDPSPMSQRRLRQQRQRRGLILTAGGLSGLVLGLVVVSVATGGGMKKVPADYAPFPAGPASSVTRSVERGGPIFYPDAKDGTNGFYLDVEDGEIVALAVVPAGGNPECPVAWDRQDRRYEDCESAEVPAAELDRFKVLLSGEGPDKSVFVDIRTVVAAPGRTG